MARTVTSRVLRGSRVCVCLCVCACTIAMHGPCSSSPRLLPPPCFGTRPQASSPGAATARPRYLHRRLNNACSCSSSSSSFCSRSTCVPTSAPWNPNYSNNFIVLIIVIILCNKKNIFPPNFSCCFLFILPPGDSPRSTLCILGDSKPPNLCVSPPPPPRISPSCAFGPLRSFSSQTPSLLWQPCT
jgi:hypothetical protein